jgi:hypothetical protein
MISDGFVVLLKVVVSDTSVQISLGKLRLALDRLGIIGHEMSTDGQLTYGGA